MPKPSFHRILPLLALLTCALSAGLGQPRAANAASAKEDHAKPAAEDVLKNLENLTAQSIDLPAKTSLSIPDAHNKLIKAEVTRLDLAGYDYTAGDGASGRNTWFDTHDGSDANAILKKAVNAKEMGHNLLAARILLNLKMGEPLAKFYINQAAGLDKGMKASQLQPALEDLAIADYNKNKPEWAWPRLTPGQEADRIKEIETSVRAQAKQVGLSFPLCDQSEHFVFYTDADLGTARQWARKLENAYKGLCVIFNLDPHQNIWQGKCAVVLCRSQANYAKWMQAVAPGNAMAAKSAGLSVSSSVFPGSNTIHFFHNGGNLAYTETTLYHELTHAFTAQFHGNHHLASWANEGLAEYISTGHKGNDQKRQESHERVRASNSLEDFFAATNIQFAHYGSAFEITSLLIKKNPKGYAKFVKDITEGKDPADSLKDNCNLTLDQLTAGYARMLGMRNLKSH